MATSFVCMTRASTWGEVHPELTRSCERCSRAADLCAGLVDDGGQGCFCSRSNTGCHTSVPLFCTPVNSAWLLKFRSKSRASTVPSHTVAQPGSLDQSSDLDLGADPNACLVWRCPYNLRRWRHRDAYRSPLLAPAHLLHLSCPGHRRRQRNRSEQQQSGHAAAEGTAQLSWRAHFLASASPHVT